MKEKEIRALIERRRKEWRYGSSIEAKYRAEECDDILELMDEQEESVSEFLNTESMIESYKQRLISQANGMKNSPLVDMCLVSYKHGINETLDTLNLSNVERTTKKSNASEVSSKVTSEVTSEVSEEFEKALAEEWKAYTERGAATVDALEDNTQELAFAKGFYRGANWQKEKDDKLFTIAYMDGVEKGKQQMMKDSISATIESDLDPHGADYGNQKIVCKWGELEAKKFKEGTKVKLIIIKED